MDAEHWPMSAAKQTPRAWRPNNARAVVAAVALWPGLCRVPVRHFRVLMTYFALRAAGAAVLWGGAMRPKGRGGVCFPSRVLRSRIA